MRSISVIIPVHNRRELIGRALDSVLAQTVLPEEIIVIDDGSTDDTSTFLQKTYPDITVLTRENNGVSAARNLGIQHASGEWIALLDSDDEWLPEKLARQLQAISNSPECKLIHTNEIWIRNGIRVNQMKKHQKHGGYIFKHCLPLCAISPSSVLIHRSIFTDIGLFDDTLPVCEDYDMWLRICARHPVLFLDEELIIKYGGHDDQLSRQYRGMDRFRIRAIEKILEEKVLSEDNQQAAIAMLREKISIYLQGAEKHGNTESVTEFTDLLHRYHSEQQVVLKKAAG